MTVCPAATYRAVPSHGGPMDGRVRGVVLHVQQGDNSPYGWFSDPAHQASSHFWVSRFGQIEQYVDTELQAWCQAAGNHEWWSIETEGWAADELTAAQIQSGALIYEWLQQLPTARFGFTEADAPDQYGLGWHGMGGTGWGNHPGCPGDLRKAQRPVILAAAQHQPAPPPDPGPTSEVPTVVVLQHNGDFLLYGGKIVPLDVPVDPRIPRIPCDDRQWQFFTHAFGDPVA